MRTTTYGYLHSNSINSASSVIASDSIRLSALSDYWKKRASRRFEKLEAELMTMSPENVRIVYGGGHTILINKKTGKRLCMVTRDKDDPEDLTRAVLYLLLKYKGLGGSKIHEWSSSMLVWVMLRMWYNFERDFLYWLLDNAYHSYSSNEADEIIHTIYYHKDSSNSLNSFLYFLCKDRYGIKREDIDALISEATCSEKQKPANRLCTMDELTSGKTNSFDLEVNKIFDEIKKVSSTEEYLAMTLKNLKDICQVLKEIIRQIDEEKE